MQQCAQSKHFLKNTQIREKLLVSLTSGGAPHHSPDPGWKTGDRNPPKSEHTHGKKYIRKSRERFTGVFSTRKLLYRKECSLFGGFRSPVFHPGSGEWCGAPPEVKDTSTFILIWIFFEKVLALRALSQTIIHEFSRIETLTKNRHFVKTH
jgi:hypothetical protein